MDALVHLDQALLLSLNQLAGKSVALDVAVRGIANLYIIKIGPFCAALWWLWFRKEGTGDAGPTGSRRLVVDAVIGAALAVLLSMVIQALMPERPRPLHDLSVPFVPPLGQSREALKNWSSFPSDNAAIAFALAASFFRPSRLAGVLACLWAAVVVCLPRVYLGLHYPGDVTAGALIGIASAVIAARLVPTTGVYRLVWWLEDRYRPWFYSGVFLMTYEMVVLFEDVRRAAGGAAKVLRGLGHGP
ncbi:phosphatase PAP2 family protein [Azospirillum sp. TSO35-2]|uniref:phosphatase PAP2 family protein n=1 Tax=Azospirillum sp. TSO35-2 TaxID=716796 RepID=UPI000D603C51|nr:phosphatase PAP2 family protein [Azospirillum sp. TSO35-2]PWC39460.1 hypothetical protein TSO352_04735 [Azospirillum sp. TSO35-2]